MRRRDGCGGAADTGRAAPRAGPAPRRQLLEDSPVPAPKAARARDGANLHRPCNKVATIEGRDTLVDDTDQATRRRAALRGAEPPVRSAGTGRKRFVLESPGGSDGSPRRTLLQPLPFRLGRKPGLELVLPSKLVSKAHAEIYERDGALRVRDLGSVERHPPEPGGGDRRAPAGRRHPVPRRLRVPGGRLEGAGDDPEEDLLGATMHRSVLTAAPALRGRHPGAPRAPRPGQRHHGLPAHRAAARREPAAWEAWVEGVIPGLPESPLDLFRIAATSGNEAELSRLFRRRGGGAGAGPARPTRPLPEHPSRGDEGERASGVPRGAASPGPHGRPRPGDPREHARPSRLIAALRERLSEINVGLAYDDFGSGQSRLLELAEAPPHYLRFDRCFIPVSRRRLRHAAASWGRWWRRPRELRVKTVAEGVETTGEAEACREVGITHAQGYLFGRPAPAEQQVTAWRREGPGAPAHTARPRTRGACATESCACSRTGVWNRTSGRGGLGVAATEAIDAPAG